MAEQRYHAFLSHSSKDSDAVKTLAALLEREGIHVWMDIAELLPGDDWQEKIETALHNCDCCVVAVGPSGITPWQKAEVGVAFDRSLKVEGNRFRLIPLILPGASHDQIPDFLARKEWCDFSATLDDPYTLDRLRRAILNVPLDVQPSSKGTMPTGTREQPYRGLSYFDVADARFFFGRRDLTKQTLDLLKKSMADPTQRSPRFAAIIGSSGSGKSSLARAGVIAALQADADSEWRFAICRLRDDPLGNLGAALAVAFNRQPSLGDLREFSDNARAMENGLTRAVNIFRGTPASREHLLLFVDQFEECFTLCEDAAVQKALIENLIHAATSPDSATSVLIALRADEYGECLRFPGLAALLNLQVRVIPMAESGLREAIEEPARVSGTEIETGLADLLIASVRDNPACLPLLQYTLQELWNRSQPRMTIAAYQALGGVEGVLQRRAEDVFSHFYPEEQEICRRIFLRLIHVLEGGRRVARRVPLPGLLSANRGANVVRPVVLALAAENARLLTIEGGAGPDDEMGIEIAHESLIGRWARLDQWLKEDLEFQLWRSRLELALAAWERTKHDDGALLRGALLDEARRRQTQRPDDLNSSEQSFIDASWGLHREERRRRLALATGFAAFAAVCSVVFYTLDAKNSSRSQAVEILAGLKGNNIPLALRAVQKSPTREALEALHAAVQVARHPALEIDSAPILTVAFSAGSEWLATGTKDGATDVWDGGARVTGTYNHQARYAPDNIGPDQAAANKSVDVLSVAFSKDSSMILMASADGLLRLWKWQSSEPPVTFGPVGDVLTRAAFSADGQRLLAACRDGTIKIWDLATPGAPRDRIQVGSPVQALAARGAYIASGSADGRVRLWRSDTLAAAGDLDSHEKAVTDLSFSPDARYLASTGNDGKLQVWQVDSRRRLFVRAVDSNGVAGVAFTPGGDEVVTAGLSGVANVWDAKKGGDGLALLGRKSNLPLTSVAFPLKSGPDGRKCVAVAGWDGAVHTYELNFQLLEADARKLMQSLAAAPGSP